MGFLKVIRTWSLRDKMPFREMRNTIKSGNALVAAIFGTSLGEEVPITIYTIGKRGTANASLGHVPAPTVRRIAVVRGGIPKCSTSLGPS
jgi:hypothetical protein